MPLINQKVIDYLLSTTSCNSESEIKSECIYSDDRVIYRLTCNELNYIFKTIGTSRKSTDEFSIEFNLIEKIWGLTAGEISMPKPLLLLDDGFLMTECDGSPLKDKYYRSLTHISDRKNIRKSFSLCAHWLSNFHKHTLSDDNYDSAFTNRKQHLSRMIESIKTLDQSTSTDKLMCQIQDYFESVNALKKNLMCQLHGNFALRNILYNDKLISLIDFEDSKFDTIYYDLGMFVAEIMNKSILVINKKYNNVLIDDFISEYNKSLKINKKILHSFVLYHLVSSYYDVVNRAIPASFFKKILYMYKRKFTLSLVKSSFESVEL